MTIYKLVMRINFGYRYEPEEVSYHLTREIATAYAKRKLETGYYYKDCIEGSVVTLHKDYYNSYFIEPIKVNDK